MDAYGQIAFGSNFELAHKHLLLLRKVVVFYPFIQADLTNARGNLFKKIDQHAVPLRGALSDVPRVITEGGNDLRDFPRQFKHRRPILFAGTVDYHSTNVLLGGSEQNA